MIHSLVISSFKIFSYFWLWSNSLYYCIICILFCSTFNKYVPLIWTIALNTLVVNLWLIVLLIFLQFCFLLAACMRKYKLKKLYNAMDNGTHHVVEAVMSWYWTHVWWCQRSMASFQVYWFGTPTKTVIVIAICCRFITFFNTYDIVA